MPALQGHPQQLPEALSFMSRGSCYIWCLAPHCETLKDAEEIGGWEGNGYIGFSSKEGEMNTGYTVGVPFRTIPLLLWLNLFCWFLTSFKLQCTFSAILNVTVCQDAVQRIGHVSFYGTGRGDEVVLWERKLFLTTALVCGFHRFN